MIRAGILGASGYAGSELARLLAAHPDVEVCWYGSHGSCGEEYAKIYPNLFTFVESSCREEDLEAAAKEVDVLFSAAPQGFLSSVLSEDILSRCKVIDLSADFRLKDVSVYEAWYGIKHGAKDLVGEAVYGLTEEYREQIRHARLTANPGCYPTCTFFAVAPALKAGLVKPDSIIIDAKSGTSGAGRSAKTGSLFCEVNENMKAYSVGSHRHTPEIEEQLSAAAKCPVRVTFTPHLVPMNRGILVTAYASLKDGVREEDVREAYENAYENEPFIRLLKDGQIPETRYVAKSNYTDVNMIVDRRTNRLIMMGAMDNLVKGAAGQAVQNMNLMFDLPEQTGLTEIPAAL